MFGCIKPLNEGLLEWHCDFHIERLILCSFFRIFTSIKCIQYKDTISSKKWRKTSIVSLISYTLRWVNIKIHVFVHLLLIILFPSLRVEIYQQHEQLNMILGHYGKWTALLQFCIRKICTIFSGTWLYWYGLPYLKCSRLLVCHSVTTFWTIVIWT